MSAFTIATAAPIVKTVEDNVLTFARLKRKHLVDLLTKWAGEDKPRLIDNLVKMKVPANEAAEQLNTFDRMSSTLPYGVRACYSIIRSEETCLKSLQLHNASVSPAVLDLLNPEEVQLIALELWGVTPDEEQETKEGDNKTENPT